MNLNAMRNIQKSGILSATDNTLDPLCSFQVDKSYNSAVTHSMKQFTAGSIYIYMAMSKCLIIDVGEKSHFLVSDVVSGLQN